MSSIKERIEAMRRKKAEAAAGGSASGAESAKPATSQLPTPAATPGTASDPALSAALSGRVEAVVEIKTPAAAPIVAAPVVASAAPDVKPAPSATSNAQPDPLAVASSAKPPAKVSAKEEAAAAKAAKEAAEAARRVAMPVAAALDDATVRTPGPANYHRDPPLPLRATSAELATSFFNQPKLARPAASRATENSAAANSNGNGKRSRSPTTAAPARSDDTAAPPQQAPRTEGDANVAGGTAAHHGTRPVTLPGAKHCRPSSEFVAKGRISEGVYGVVCKGVEKATGRALAMKWLREKWFAESRAGFPDYLLREIDLLHRMQHPNVLGALCVATERRKPEEVAEAQAAAGGPPGPLVSHGSQHTRLFVITDYAGCNLRSEIYRSESHLGFPAMRHLASGMLHGLDFMHRNGIVHRDLKPSNVLVDVDCTVKLCDMGLARGLRPRERDLTVAVITLMYRPPELHFGVRDYATDVDVWSFGCILAEMLIRDPLFPATEDPDHFRVVCEVMGAPDQRVWPDLLKLRGARRILRETKVAPEAVGASSDAHYSSSFLCEMPSSTGQCTMPTGGVSCVRLREHLMAKRPDLFGPDASVPVQQREEALLLVDLVDRILQWDPKYRPTAQEVLTHPFFAGREGDASPAEIAERRRTYEEEQRQFKAKQRAERAAAKEARVAAAAAAAASAEGAAVETQAAEEAAAA
eukprot:CAMPEP_0174834946 /NCGR_PEP_ID=MMETSP1114-20130205/5136_1 /TAXON_ID=312471 /ORGANISM="Neobodo designis, Strain CCAP 1951/1" /LENGTH=697 /DNA_ID=CAMNT_0016068877 /DNA_START=47 /DNA_END=2137 /DNA_ORIENTATION=-